MRATVLTACLGLGVIAACVPADEAMGLGSVQFSFTVSERTQEGVPFYETADDVPWSLRFNRIVLGFKTMTIGKIGVEDACAFRGRGAASDVVFDPRFGLVQTFNGIQPTECPDVGVIFGPPGSGTTLGAGVTSKDLIELATGEPAHAIVEATATRHTLAREPGGRPVEPKELRIRLRFDSERTSTRFGGCREAARGTRIFEGRRDDVAVRFAAENLFRDALAPRAGLRVHPFEYADTRNDENGIVTMDELDRTPLGLIDDTEFYLQPDGSRSGSFGDFVRALFRFSIMFRTEDGLCVGNEPGAEEGSQAAP
jgi:hypothetical protein